MNSWAALARCALVRAKAVQATGLRKAWTDSIYATREQIRSRRLNCSTICREPDAVACRRAGRVLPSTHSYARSRHLKSGGIHVATKRRPRQIPNQPKAKAATSATRSGATDCLVQTPGRSGGDRSTDVHFEAVTRMMTTSFVRALDGTYVFVPTWSPKDCANAGGHRASTIRIKWHSELRPPSRTARSLSSSAWQQARRPAAFQDPAHGDRPILTPDVLERVLNSRANPHVGFSVATRTTM
jgi:hypothetical protein